MVVCDVLFDCGLILMYWYECEYDIWYVMCGKL